MKKNKLNSFYLIDKFPKHEELKKILLKEINQNIIDNRKIQNEDYTDYFSTDWTEDNLRISSDFTRKWVTIIYDDLINFFNNTFLKLGYQKCIIKDLWFQQYKNKGTHGWHIHGGSFTGAYYLDLPKNSPPTQISHPFDNKNIINLKVKEGDVSIFPTHVVHRSPINMSKNKKTIISFNLEFQEPTDSVIENLMIAEKNEI